MKGCVRMFLYPDRFGSKENFPKKSDFEVKQIDEKIGKAVICYKEFFIGDLVAEITGDIIHEIAQHTLQITSEQHLYDIWFSGYFAHSCDPNVVLDMKRGKVFSIRHISPGDLLYMDYYQTEDHLFKSFPCTCGSKICRGLVKGKKDV